MKGKGKYTGKKDCKNNEIYVGNIIRVVNQNRFFEVCYVGEDDEFHVRSNELKAPLKTLIKQFSIEIIKENSIDEFDKSLDIFQKLTLKECVFKIVKERLSFFNGNNTKTAESLDISRSRVYRIMNNKE